jgi:hypothetical protein
VIPQYLHTALPTWEIAAATTLTCSLIPLTYGIIKARKDPSIGCGVQILTHIGGAVSYPLGLLLQHLALHTTSPISSIAVVAITHILTIVASLLIAERIPGSNKF